MLFVYALTRAATHGWGSPGTVGLIGASLVLVALFVWIEHRAASPLLPLRMFRLPTLPAANITHGDRRRGHVLGVLRPHALPAGRPALHADPVRRRVLGFAGTVVLSRTWPSVVIERFGVRPTLTAGLVAGRRPWPGSSACPSTGTTSGIFSRRSWSAEGASRCRFVAISIASLAGVERQDAGIAAGLFNTSRQIGGAIGIAAVSAIAATAGSHYASAHDVAAASAPALDHGFQTALIVLAGLLAGAAVLAWVFVRPRPVAHVETLPSIDLAKEAA